jgi:hypothetical protein
MFKIDINYSSITLFLGMDIEYDSRFLGLRLDAVLSIGRRLIGCYIVIREGTHFQFFVTETSVTETVPSFLRSLLRKSESRIGLHIMKYRAKET